LFLRSAVLTAAGIWSMRVWNADQAAAVLSRVSCAALIVCHTLDEENRQAMLALSLSSRFACKSVWLDPGDDRSGTRFLTKVENALDQGPPPNDAYTYDYLKASA
jgi:hypothetical protein